MTAERILAQVGWVVAALLLVVWVASQQLAVRLDWLQFGTSYQAQQQQVVTALNELAGRLAKVEKAEAKAP
jgi:hypothetical protein